MLPPSGIPLQGRIEVFSRERRHTEFKRIEIEWQKIQERSESIKYPCVRRLLIDCHQYVIRSVLGYYFAPADLHFE